MSFRAHLLYLHLQGLLVNRSVPAYSHLSMYMFSITKEGYLTVYETRVLTAPVLHFMFIIIHS